MLADIIFVSLIVIGVLGIGVVWYLDVMKCKHTWEIIHDTKYDNVGFRDKYYVVLVCTKCGKVKKIK